MVHDTHPKHQPRSATFATPTCKVQVPNYVVQVSNLSVDRIESFEDKIESFKDNIESFEDNWGKSDGAIVEEIPKSKGEGKPVDRAPTEEGPAMEDGRTSERRGSDWCSVGGGAQVVEQELFEDEIRWSGVLEGKQD
ncbi:hypothetical protein LXL04_003992 [Taraxacum kok-saghyz]